MLKRLQIRHFRGFNDLNVEQLSGINLIAGKNNAGKTSLLEALFLLAGAGNAQMALNANVLRGLESNVLLAGEPFWKQLFFNLDMGRPIEIKGVHASRGRLTLQIASERQPATEIPLDRPGRLSETNLFDERTLAFQYFRGTSKKPAKSRIRLGGQGVEMTQPATNVPFPAAILLSRLRSIHEDAVRLGMLRRQKQGHLLVKALQVVDPRLQSIEDNSSSGIPMIWGDIGLSELVPLSVMGEGMAQIARLVLAIASTPNGVVLVDEVENGFHHSVLPDIWRAVDTAAKQFRTQVFATTHSLECVAAAHESLSTDRFRLHRLETDGKMNRCVTYEPDSIDAAIRHGLEVR